jgi:hypothetical protein
MKTTSELITAGADRLERMGWCQGSFAQDKNDQSVPPDDEEACSFCAVGAMRAVGQNVLIGRAIHALSLAASRTITRWNDDPGRTKDEVIALMRRTAAKLEAGQWQN